MIIIGAGLSGLVAAAMLRDNVHQIFEAQNELPHNHSAVLRFRSPVVGDATGIAFRSVDVLKATAPWMNPVADALSYSTKTNGTARLRSIVASDYATVKRYISPPNLVEQLSQKLYCSITFSHAFGGDLWDKAVTQRLNLISTLPMEKLMQALDYPPYKEGHIRFNSVTGYNVVADLDPKAIDAYCTLYVPDPEVPFARISITGSQLIAECYLPEDKINTSAVLDLALKFVGIDRYTVLKCQGRKQRYAKITPIDEGERRRFIMWASDNWRVYSLGRFATWRPGLLLDDVVNDVRVIQKLVANRGEQYAHRMKG